MPHRLLVAQCMGPEWDGWLGVWAAVTQGHRFTAGSSTCTVGGLWHLDQSTYE